MIVTLMSGQGEHVVLKHGLCVSSVPLAEVALDCHWSFHYINANTLQTGRHNRRRFRPRMSYSCMFSYLYGEQLHCKCIERNVILAFVHYSSSQKVSILNLWMWIAITFTVVLHPHPHPFLFDIAYILPIKSCFLNSSLQSCSFCVINPFSARPFALLSTGAGFYPIVSKRCNATQTSRLTARTSPCKKTPWKQVPGTGNILWVNIHGVSRDVKKMISGQSIEEKQR